MNSHKQAKNKIFEFHGFDLKRAVAGGLAAAFAGLAVSVAVGYFVIFINHPGFFFIVFMITALPLAALFGKYYKNFWSVTISEKQVKIFCDGQTKGEFSLSEIKELKVNGWFRWKLENASKLLSAEVGEADAGKRSSPNYIRRTQNPSSTLTRFRNSFEELWRDTNRTASGSHRRVKITTDKLKVSIMLGDIAFVNTSDKREILIFDEFLSILENYAIKKKYEKITRNNFGLSPAYVKIYSYVRR